MLRLKNVARMLTGSFLLSAALLASSQHPEQTYSDNNNNEGSNHSSNKSTAEEFISAFYSWDATQLKRLMAADADGVAILYYQGWAEAANYKVKLRHPCRIETNEVVCAITVTDDFGSAMGYEATDTFRLTLSRNKIAAVTFSGDDQTIFEELVQWITEKHPDILTGPCLDMFAGGTTPAACARAVAKAARDFMTDRGKAIL